MLREKIQSNMIGTLRESTSQEQSDPCTSHMKKPLNFDKNSFNGVLDKDRL